MFPLKIVIFHGYVCLPEGISPTLFDFVISSTWRRNFQKVTPVVNLRVTLRPDRKGMKQKHGAGTGQNPN